jgi:hypothetical protein
VNIQWLKPMLEGLFEAAPHAIDFVETIVKDEKAKRVEEIRPPTSHSQTAIEDVLKSKPQP